MKVTGFQVEEHGSGYAFTIRIFAGREEMADEWLEGVLARVKEDLFGHEEEEHEDTQADGDDETKTPGTPDDKRATARGRRRVRRDAVGGASDAPAGRDDNTSPAPDAGAATAPKGRGGRRSRPSAGTAKAVAEVEVKKARGRRPRNSTVSGAGTEEEKPTTSPTTAPTAGRRSRKGGSSAKPAKTTKSPSKDAVSDEDLTKAASQAAAEIGPSKVMDVLDEFSVAEVKHLKQEQRPDFIARLNDERGR